jgi:hypothetical protein
MITVITFYTPEYTNEMKEWEKTCKEFLKFPYKAYAVKSKGNWTHNCTMKAEVILQALNEFKTGIVWTDADARFRAYPKVFEELHNYDFGCYWIPNVWNQSRNAALKPWSRGNEALAGGTLFFNNTDMSKKLIDAWKKQSEANPTVWEQQSLQKVWENFDNDGMKTFNFPQSYCKVFDCKWFQQEQPVVIEHMQASRKLKSKIK